MKYDDLKLFYNKDNREYFEILEKEAQENTWEEKAKSIIDLLEKYEK